MDVWSRYYSPRTTDFRTIDPQDANRHAMFLAEQCLYEHLLERVKVEEPEELIARFRVLYINGIGYSDDQVWQALKTIVDSPFAQKNFKFILNRSSYILINHWLLSSQQHSAITDLAAVFDAPPNGYGRSRTTQRLRELVQNFHQTDQYKALKRLAQVVQLPECDGVAGSLGSLIRRYPCLYEHSLLTEDSTAEQRRRIRSIRRRLQQQFERDLARYATHKLLAVGMPDSSSIASKSHLNNPTLLSDRKLGKALRQFGGKIDGSNTCRDLAQRFLTYSSHACSYGSFKEDLYNYLTDSIDSKYGKQQFNQRLYAYLRDTFPEHNSHRLNDVLLAGTCRKLLNFLLVESPQQPSHAVFVDLTGNLGTIKTIDLLLKIVLICRSVKPYLEKQFAILFNHYESYSKDSVVWLVESLENLNIAFSINFGTLSL
jgi:hypothetical protein